MSKITKNIAFIFFCMLLHTLGTKLNSQPQSEFICGTCQEYTKQNVSSLQHNSLSKVATPLGGDRRRIPTDGTLKILIIFARFSGDNSVLGSWPANSNSLPLFANSIIDSIVKQPPSEYTKFSVSSFFKEMSGGRFNVIGKVFPELITLNNNESYYENLYNLYNYSKGNSRNGVTNLEVLKKVDSIAKNKNNINFNFKEFDNWTRTLKPNVFPYEELYDVSPGPDGIIDMVVIIYRNKEKKLFQFTGIACLAEPTTHWQSNGSNPALEFIYYKTKDSVKIGGAFKDTWDIQQGDTVYYQSSGITVRYTGESLRGLTNTITHELGHYIGGSGHTDGYGFASGNKSLYAASMSSIEKNQLGYLNFIDIVPNVEYEATDYLSNNKSFRYKADTNLGPYGWKEWFIIENHQKVSDWDMVGGKVKSDDMDPYTGANPATVGKGLYIFRYYDDGSQEYIYPIPADGRWIWNSCGAPNPFGGKDPIKVYNKIYPSRSTGEDEWKIGQLFREGPCYKPIETDYTGNAAGRNTAAWNVGYNQVFSPYSNPNTAGHSSGTQYPFAIEVTRQIGSSIYFKFHSDPNVAPPSKPQFLKISYDYTTAPLLRWYRNVEPNLIGYNIYRAVHKPNVTPSYNKLNNSPITDSIFYDMYPIPQGLFNNEDSVIFSYRITAVANCQNVPKESVPSDTVRMYIGKYYAGTISSSTTWNSTILVAGNITINNGVTLTINPGTTVIVGGDYKITSYGKINASGTSANRIKFISLTNNSARMEWGGIVLYNSGSAGSTFNYCEIKNGFKENGGYMLSFYNNSGSKVGYCDISYNIGRATAGIYVENSNTKIYKNKLQNNSEAVTAYNCGYLMFGDGGLQLDCNSGNNTITGNSTGIWASYYSNFDLQVVVPEINDMNNISGNSINARATNHSYIEAKGNYWGGDPPPGLVTDGTSSIIARSISCIPSLPFKMGVIEEDNKIISTPELKKVASSNVISSEIGEEIERARGLAYSEKFNKAMDIYKSILSTNRDNGYTDQALNGILYMYRIKKDKEILEYLKGYSKGEANPFAKMAYANALIVGNYVDEALSEYAEVAKNNFKTFHEIPALIQQSYIYYFDKNDVKKAKEILAEIEKITEKDDVHVKQLRSIIATNTSSKDNNIKFFDNEDIKETEVKIEGYSLGNYPNPFNPTTNIQFTIPKDEHVKLTIYDITGRVVKELVNGYKTAGKYSIEFNANNYASGTYYYKLEAGEYKNIQKMMLIK